MHIETVIDECREFGVSWSCKKEIRDGIYGESMLIEWDGRIFLFFVILSAGSVFNIYIYIYI